MILIGKKKISNDKLMIKIVYKKNRYHFRAEKKNNSKYNHNILKTLFILLI